MDSSIPKSGGVGDYEVGRVGNAAARTGSHEAKESNTCSLCGAWRGAYGLEPTVEMYVAHSVEILREIRRVLRKDGVCFWNLGDSYASQPAGNKIPCGFSQVGRPLEQINTQKKQFGSGIKPKDLCLIPFRVAIAAQEDGWWVRSVIIWNKPNPMPESVTDRPTESHEYILMLTKSAKYYWDMEAVREVYTEPLNRWGGNDVRNSSHKYIDSYENGGDNGGIGAIGETSMLRAGAETRPNPNGRNLRSVWSFPTHGYAGAHFATFPEKLPELCIKAATPEEGCCSKCGTAWERITESQKGFTNGVCNSCGQPENKHIVSAKSSMVNFGEDDRSNKAIPCSINKTIDWQPACKCNADKVPSTVLDCFGGAGTSALVATKLGRNSVTYELSTEYCDLYVERNRQSGLF